MRDILTALAALVALALMALMVAPHVIDWEQHRLSVAAAIEDATGIATRIRGPLRVGLLPTPELDAGDIEFGPEDSPLARAGRLSVALSPMALIAGRIEVTAARADRAEIVRDAFPRLVAGGGAAGARFREFGVQRLDFRAARLVSRIGGGVAGQPVFDGQIEAPHLAGPYRIEFSDQAGARDVHLQVGRFEDGRARMRGLVEAKGIAGRATLEGWFALPGVPGRPVFDGQITFGGNLPLPGGAARLPFQGQARVIWDRDRVVAEPLSVAIGPSETAVQFSGRAGLDFAGHRPRLDLRLAAKRYDAVLLLDAAARGAAPSATDILAAILASSGASIDATLDLSLEALQLPGATIGEIAVAASIRGGAVALDRLAMRLPGATRLTFARDARAGPEPVAGRLEIESAELDRFVAWLRGGEAEKGLPAGATLSARLAGEGRSVTMSGLRIESSAGALSGSGAFALAEPGKRMVSRLVFDLSADRFDARVLGALDPLRPIPGVELGTRLSVARLVLDREEIGGLRVALDRDGSMATLREFRLSGRSGEEVTLSGTASADLVQLTAKLDAEHLDHIARLVRVLVPGPLAESFARRAPALEPALAVANIRIATRGGEAIWDVAIDGKLGGSTLVGRSTSTLGNGETRVKLDAEANNPDGGRLVAQIAATAPRTGGGPARLKFTAEGNPRGAIGGRLDGSLAGISLAAEGDFSLFRVTPLDARLSLKAADLRRVAEFLEIPLPATEARSGFEMSGRVAGETGKITIGALEARLGGATATGEIAFDLRRGGQVAGRLRLGDLDAGLLLAPVLGTSAPGAGMQGTLPPPRALPLLGDLWVEGRMLALGNARFVSPQFIYRFAPESVSIEGFEARLDDARIAGRLTAQRQGSRAEFSGLVEFARLPLPLVGGRVNGHIPFSTGGESMAELVGGLTGAGRIEHGGGAIAAADPAALARLVAIDIDQLAPIDENRIGARLLDELRKGAAPVPPASWSVSLINGLARIGGVAKTASAASPVTVTPSLSLDLLRGEAEARLSYRLATLPKGWSGAVPDFSLTLSAPLSATAMPRRTLQVASLVNGLLAMAIQRDLERAEAIEADIRERAMHLRRQKGDAWRVRREAEIHAIEEMLRQEEALIRAREAAAMERARQQVLKALMEKEAKEREAAERAARARLIEEQQRAAPPAPPATGTPLILAPGAPPG